MNDKIVCQKCKYYYVTWEPNKPHGCKAFGFKSRLLPSLVVRQSSNKTCHMYQEKVKNEFR